MVRADLGLAPYEVLHQGLSVQTPLTIGQASIAVGVLVLASWIPLGQRPGIGTITNIVGVGLALDALLAVLWVPESLPLRGLSAVVGVVFIGIGVGLYIGSGLGPGPRDGLMTGLSRLGAPIWLVRLGMELTALVLGWLLGGTVGIATVLVAVGLPVLADWSLRRFSLPPDHPRHDRHTGDAP